MSFPWYSHLKTGSRFLSLAWPMPMAPMAWGHGRCQEWRGEESQLRAVHTVGVFSDSSNTKSIIE